ncbi:MAG: hypothetical protein DHS20C17_32420 [Cyclobacteriaceae bacterium]|nr:MAG: hypothetical protein DHS20C17_32420 [Cyclobacteriaceae bacterium]
MTRLKWVIFGFYFSVFFCLHQAEGQAINADRPISLEEAKTFFDTFFESEMPDNNIPGAVLVFVQGDSVKYRMGYGHASLEDSTLVDPKQTVFRVASISKLVTATAVLQLVESGKIGLENHINEYLDFRVGDINLAPIKVGHLLTHQSGLDERFIHWATYDQGETMPLEAYLKKYLPPQINSPGLHYDYSNHGYALLGYLVERQSGESFSNYVREYIQEPLQMFQSGFDDDLKLQTKLATGYQYKSGRYHPMPYLYYHGGPAASFLSTGEDMAHFMIAQLNHGVFANSRILKDSTVALMHEQHFTNHPSQPGTALGFWSSKENGISTLEHAGDTPGFSSLFFMLPGERLGFFVSLTNNSFAFREKLVRHFMNHFYPAERQDSERPEVLENYSLNRFIGRYTGPFYADQSIEKLPKLFVQFSIKQTGSQLKLTYPVGLSEPTFWEPIDDLVFSEVGGADYLAFETNTQGEVTKMFISPSRYPPFTLEKISPLQYANAQLGMLALFMILFLMVFILSWTPVFRRIPKQYPAKYYSLTGIIWKLNRWTSLLNVICVLGVLQIIATVYTVFATSKSIVMWLHVLLAIPYIHILATLLTLYWTIFTLKSKSTPRSYKMFQIGYTILSILYLFFLDYWNFLGFKI